LRQWGCRHLSWPPKSSLHWSYIGQVERGQRNVTLHNILKLAEVLGVDTGIWSAACARRTEERG
jgi:hypothetical protein